MTLLEIDLKDVLSETDPDDRVVVWAPAFREGPSGALVGTRRKTIPLTDGVGSDEVVPGPLMVQVQCKAIADTKPREVVVPEEGPVTLTGLFDSAGAFTYAPPVVGQVALDAQRAEDAAVRAETVADAFGSLEGVVDQVQAASDAAVSATSSAAAASMSAVDANDSQVSAASSATAAAQSAVNAADSERVAGEHKGAAESAAAGAVLSADDAATSAGDAEDSASAAASSATTAGDHATAASGHAQAALEEADRSSSEADRAEAAAQSASTGVQPDTVGRLHLTPALRGEIDGKAPSVHNHDGAYYTKEQADGRYVGTAGDSTKTGNLDMDGGSVRYVRPDTTGGWARGLWWTDRDNSTLAGIGVQGFAGEVNSFYLGHGESPWSAPVFRAYQDLISITNLDVTGAVTGIEAADVGAAPASHTHPEYATTTDMQNRTPEIRVVSSLEDPPLPGVVYIVMGD